MTNLRTCWANGERALEERDPVHISGNVECAAKSSSGSFFNADSHLAPTFLFTTGVRRHRWSVADFHCHGYASGICCLAGDRRKRDNPKRSVVARRGKAIPQNGGGRFWMVES